MILSDRSPNSPWTRFSRYDYAIRNTSDIVLLTKSLLGLGTN